MGGSASVGALIVGTVLLSIFANAMVIALENRQRFEEIDDNEPINAQVKILNATLVSTTLFRPKGDPVWAIPEGEVINLMKKGCLQNIPSTI